MFDLFRLFRKKPFERLIALILIAGLASQREIAHAVGAADGFGGNMLNL